MDGCLRLALRISAALPEENQRTEQRWNHLALFDERVQVLVVTRGGVWVMPMDITRPSKRLVLRSNQFDQQEWQLAIPGHQRNGVVSPDELNAHGAPASDRH